MCLRGASCPITITTRKKCPACRFDKCLKRGMKLEGLLEKTKFAFHYRRRLFLFLNLKCYQFCLAIREDRTRGGRSTYQCTFALPPTHASSSGEGILNNSERVRGSGDKSGDESDVVVNGSGAESNSSKANSHTSGPEAPIPNLIRVLQLWIVCWWCFCV